MPMLMLETVPLPAMLPMVAVAVAPDPLPPVKEIVGVPVYPEPRLVSVIPVTVPPLGEELKPTVAVAPEPPPPEKPTVGALV